MYGNANHHLGTDFFLHKGVRSEVKRVQFLSASEVVYNTNMSLISDEFVNVPKVTYIQRCTHGVSEMCGVT